MTSSANIASPPPAAFRARTVRRVGGNAMSLLACDVVNRATTFVVYALVARYSGARAFGQLSLSLTIVYTLQVIAVLGLPMLIVRDVSRRPESAGRYFLPASMLVAVGSLGCLVLLGLFVLVSGYPADTGRVILLMGASVVPWSLSCLTEAVFRARERMHLMLIAAVPVNLVKAGAAFVVLRQGGSIEAVAGLIVAGHCAVMLIEWGLLWKDRQSAVDGFNLADCRRLLGDGWRFFGIDALVAVWVCIDVLMLSWFCDETAVGAFAAAVQLLLPGRMALQALVNSLFPLMCSQVALEDGNPRRLVAATCELLLVVTVPVGVLLWFGARPLIELIYVNDGFSGSVTALRIMTPTLLLYAITRVLGQFLMASGQEGRNLRILMIDVAFNLAAGALLTSKFGVIGAAVTVLLTQLLDCGLHDLSTRALPGSDSRRLVAGIRPSVLRQVVIAAAAMIALVILMQERPFLVAAAAGMLVFAAFFLVQYAVSRGGAGVALDRMIASFQEK